MNISVPQLGLTLDTASPEDAIAHLLEYAAREQASDLLFGTNEEHVAVSVRCLGVCRLLGLLSLEFGRRCLAHIKAAASMDFVEHRKPQDGYWLYPLKDQDVLDLRVNILPTRFGEDIDLRILNRARHPLDLAGLGMIPRVLQQFTEIMHGPSGLVLVTGPSGTGKTTTLYAALQCINDGQRKINTIEDPIEYALPNVRQTQVNPHLHLDFPELLRAVLRQSPDVIMIGEIRDPVTAETAVRAANSGHLVLATLHAPGAAAAIHTLQSFGIPTQFLGSSLSCVLSQRLVRLLCGRCRTETTTIPWPDLFTEISFLRSPDAPQQTFAAKGCEQCQSGYVARSGVFELLPVTNKLRHLIYEKGTAGEIYRQALHEGMISFRTAALLKVANGETSPEELHRVFPAEFLRL